MAGNSKSSKQIYRLVVMALMAAMVYLGTIIRIPLGNSKVHIANAICVFAGFILNPLDAGIAAGLGSAIYDIMHGYGLECLITFVSKFAMAMVSALLLRLLQKHNAKDYSLWNSIHELYPDDIEFKNGVKNYIKYCKNNHINKKYIMMLQSS